MRRRFEKLLRFRSMKGKESKPDSPPAGSGVYFRPGEAILADGVYRVFHAGHRVSHEVTLLGGQTFPTCEKCGDAVHFELLRPAPQLQTDPDFRIRLYQIPHPEQVEEEEAAS